MGWARGFEIGTRVAGDLLDTYNASKQRAELEKIANAQPEQSQGFTADQGEELRAAAESGQYDVGYDDTSKSYTVTPKADPTQTGRIGMQGVTDFNGQRTAGAMSDSQVANARARGMAGVVMKSDPVQGARMMRDVTQGERDDQRFGWEKDRNEREMRQGKEQEADKETMRGVEQSAGEWFKARLTGPDGTQRAATIDDQLAASQYRAAKLVEAGKLDAAEQVFSKYSSMSMAKIQLQSEERNQALGAAAAGLTSGDFGAVKDFYNKYIPDGAHVTNVGKGPKGEIVIERESADGRPMAPTTLKDTGQLLSALSSFKDPMAIYNYSQNEFRNNLALKADSRAGAQLGLSQNADKRAQSDFEAGQPRKQLESTVATLQLGLANASTPEERAVIQEKLNAVQASAGTGKDQPSEVKLAQAIVNAGMAPDMKSALGIAISKKGQSPEEMHQEFVSANIKNMSTPQDAVKKANAVMQEMGFAKKGNSWTQAGPAQEPVGNFTSSAELDAAVKAGKVKSGDRVTVNGKTGTWK